MKLCILVVENTSQGAQTVPARLMRGDRPSQTFMKQRNLAATALINSAKKAMERMKLLSVTRQTPLPMVAILVRYSTIVLYL